MSQTAANLLPVVDIPVFPISEHESANAMANAQAWIDKFGSEPVPPGARPAYSDIATTLLRAHAHATHESQAERWASLPAKEFDPAYLEALRPLAVAARVSAAAVESHQVASSKAKLPPPLVAEARKRRADSLRYLEYHLAGVVEAQAELEGIRAGSGYNDLERDLRRIAVLIRFYSHIFEDDPKYHPHDAEECNRIADDIAVGLATTPATPQPWLDRLWSAVRFCYRYHVEPTAAWLYRQSPADHVNYPSIYASYASSPSAGPAPSTDSSKS